MTTRKRRPVKPIAETPAPKPAPTAVVYCGPTLRGIAHQWTVFTGGIPTQMQALADRNPVLRDLFVPIEKFAEARALLNDPNSTLSLLYSNVLESTLLRR